MKDRDPLSPYFTCLASHATMRWTGRITELVGSLVESAGPLCSAGDACEIIDKGGNRLLGEIIGFRSSRVLSMCLDRPRGITLGDHIVSTGEPPSLRLGPGLLGRVVDALGRPLDSSGDYDGHEFLPIDGSAPLPLSRVPIREPLGCGVRAIDGFLTCGRGQRVGVFGGSGVGKSTLIGMMARGTAADLTVLALIGERGREVHDFLETLGEEGRQRSVVVVSTSDQSPLLRIRAALAATTIAEYFCRQGKHVLLVVDSVTRFAMAQREVGLAAGEPPTAKGYTPSVLNMLARLVERAGKFQHGSITGFYTVLMEGDDQQDPVVDTVRSLLDGHIVLDRALGARNHYPPIAILDSLSRLMPNVCSREHLDKVKALRGLLSAYTKSEDLVRIGAYQKGNDPVLDRAITVVPNIFAYLQQAPTDRAPLALNIERMMSLPN